MICTCGRYISSGYCTICDKMLFESIPDKPGKKKVPIKAKLKIKTCKECKEKFLPSMPFQVCCSVLCAIKLVKKESEVKELKAWKVRKKDLKEKLKTLSEYEQEARKVFQLWIRKRDENIPCISCDGLSSKYDAGHFWKAEMYSGLIFNEDNVHKQCVRCNQHLHGNEANYRIGLVKKIGEERVKWLEENKDRLRQYKFTKEELISIKQEYSKRLKEL